MRRRAFRWICVLACLGTVTALAQQGHPLTGTWTGDWGATPTQRNHLTFVMEWNGEKVTGTINPGPDSITIGSIVVDYANWAVRIEAETKDASGVAVHIIADGRLEDLGSYHRKITGNWRQGTAKGDFKITRE